MYLSRRILNLIIALLLTSAPVVLILNGQSNGSPENDTPSSRAVPWNQVTSGTKITLAPGKISNTSYYYPVPIGATVLSANISFSNIPYTQGGKDFSRDAWLNIGGDSKEYVYGIVGEGIFGSWGLQNRTVNGENVIEQDVTETTKINARFVLPKNATLRSATMDITGYQRKAEWKNYYIAGTASGEMVGYEVKDLDGRYVGVGDPGFSKNSGRVFLVYGNSDQIQSTTLVSKSASGDEFGYSISGEITVTGITSKQFAVGAPGNDTDRGYVEIMNISTAYTKFQTINGNLSGDRFGEALAVGDIDGDGDNELVVGAPGADSGVGAVNIYHIVLNLTTQKYEFDILDTINGSSSDKSFGKAISIGDINGDAKDDIAIASDQDVYIFHGESTFDTSFDSNLDPLASFPTSIIQAVGFLGAISGSGGESLGVGLPDKSRGSVLVYHGGSSYDTNPDVTFTAPTGVSNFGQDLDVGYDFNNDGTNDIAIGAPGEGLNRGYIGIYSISAVSSPLWSMTSTTAGDGYGFSVAFGTDLKGDGYGDVVVGAPKTSNLGWAWIHERFPPSELPSNTPVIYIGGAEVWSYSGEHLPEGSTISTPDLSSAINSYLSMAQPFLNSQYESYVYLDLQVGMAIFSDREESNHFKVEDFELLFDLKSSTGEIAQSFNTYLDKPDANIDHDLGIFKVPFGYGGSTEGGIRIDDIEVVVDLIPEIESYPGIIHVDEDSHTMDALDAYLLFQDDYTKDSDLEYQITKIGENRTRFTSYISDGRYVAIDLPNGTESTNWTGMIEITLAAIDVNGGRSENLDILIQVDPKNDPPAVTNLPSLEIMQGSKLQYLTHAVDDEGDEIFYHLEDAPENMTVDEQGTVLFQPNGWQVGDLEWTIVLDDGKDQRSYWFPLNVENINDPPIFSTPAPEDSEVLVGEQFSYQFNAYDLDPMDGVQYSLPEGPTGSSIAFELGLLTWTPIIYLEEPQKFRVRATDREGAYSELIFFVNVTLTDNPPTITSEPIIELSDYVEWYYNLWVTELDDDIFFVELSEGPPGMYYDDISESLIWTPNGSQIGSHEVSIMVSSTRFKIFQNFTVYVSRSPRVWDMRMDISKDGMKIKGNLVIGGTVTVSPSQVRGMFIKVGDTEIFLSIEGESWTYEIDTRKYDDGYLDISVKAFDGYENSTETSIEVYIANDEGKTSPIFIVLVIIALFLIIAACVLGVILAMRRKKSKEEEQEKKKQFEDLQKSKQDMEQFIQSSDKVQDDTGLYDQVEDAQIDEKRLEAIDDIFSPMTGEVRSDLGAFTDEIPEDILQKSNVQESMFQQEPPSPENDNETP